MNLKLVQCEGMGDWYTIEKADHGHTEAMIPQGPGSMSYWHSGRIADADVEGPLVEMVAIAEAIERRGKAHFKRCAVDATSDEVRFWSPRNSRMHGVAYIDDANDLAKQIRATASVSLGG